MTIQNCAQLAPSCSPTRCNDALTRDGNTIKTGRYDITVTKVEVKVYDTKTSTWVKAWGDPHVITSDGDKAQFHTKNLTLDLQDGTKVTIKPTACAPGGVALVDQVAVMRGRQGMVVADVSTGPKFGSMQTSAAVDRQHEDGTVLRAGGQVDDLTFTSSGKELVGSDPTQRFQEHMLDGQGGTSRYDFTRVRHCFQQLQGCRSWPQLWSNFTQQLQGGGAWGGGYQGGFGNGQFGGHGGGIGGGGQAGGWPVGGGASGGNGILPGGCTQPPVKPCSTGGSSSTSGSGDAELDALLAQLENGGIGAVWAVLFKLINAIDKQIVDKVKQMAQRKRDLGQVEGQGDTAKRGDTEGKMEALGFEIQRLKQVRQQISGMLTNILKTDGDTKMSIINNLRS